MTPEKNDPLMEQLENMGTMKQDPQQAAADIERTREKLLIHFAAEPTPVQLPWRRWAMAAAALIFLGALLYHLLTLSSASSVAWADVVERFNTVPFFNAVVYSKENAADEPTQLELWVGQEGQARLRIESQVLFAEAGEITGAFDFRTRKRLLPDQYNLQGERLIKRLSRVTAFDLDTIINVLGSSYLKEITPTINTQAVIASDMVVFDLTSKEYPHWQRIWALRESRLPVRMRSWNPTRGSSKETLITYANAQPQDFFDPQAYEKVLHQAIHVSSKANLAYAFLKDPGGRDYVPQDLFDQTGYHIPQVQRMGRTPYGAVWVVADQAENRKPNGRTFWGFGFVTDDLGRIYSSIHSSHNVIHDRSVQIYLPPDYPFDRRVPQEITLTCTPSQEHPDERVTPIGSIECKEWEANTVWTEDVYKKTETAVMLSQAKKYARTRSFEKCDNIITLVKANNPTEQQTYTIQKIELLKHNKRKEFKQAAALARDIWPKLMHEYMTPTHSVPDPILFKDAIIAFAGGDQFEETQARCQQVYEAKPDLSRFHPNAQRKIRERLQREWTEGYGVKMLIKELRLNVGWSIEQVNELFGGDLRRSDELSPYLTVNDEYQAKQNAWNNYLQKLSEIYKEHPLDSGQVRLRPYPDTLGPQSIYMNYPLPKLSGYRVSTLKWPLKTMAPRWCPGRTQWMTDINDLELNHILVTRDDVNDIQIFLSTVNHLGIKVTEKTAPVSQWIAHYNGQALKAYHDVVAPGPICDDSYDTGKMSQRSQTGLHLITLLKSLSNHQDLIVENQTGIPDMQIIALECPSFKGPKGRTFAKKWFQENFGITFKQQTKNMTVWLIEK